MLDIKFIKENPDLIKEAIRKKHVKLNLDDLLAVEEKRMTMLHIVEELRAEQNRASTTIAETADPEKKVELIRYMQEHKDKMASQEAELKAVTEEWRALMLQVPNIPDISVPEGKSDEDNKPIKFWGDKPTFDFKPKDHVEIMTTLGMVDFPRGTKVHGFRGYFLMGAGARLSWAIWNYANDFFWTK